MDHAVRVREGHGVADLLENGEQRAERIYSNRCARARGHQLQHFLERDTAHHFHRVVGLPVFIHAQVVDRDVWVFELRGPAGLGDEAREIFGRGTIEHHLHDHAARRGRVARLEDRSHAALHDHAGDFAFRFMQKFLRQQPPHRDRARRERDIRRRQDHHAVKLQGRRKSLPEHSGISSFGLLSNTRIFRRAAAPYGPHEMKPFLIRWLVTTIAVAVAAKLLPGIHTEGWMPLVGMALFLGVINAVIRPVLLLLSLPFIIVTLGFFILIVNTLTFWLAGGLVPGLHVAGFWNAFFGSIVVSIVSWALSGFVRGPDGQVRILTQEGQFRAGSEKRVEGRTIE